MFMKYLFVLIGMVCFNLTVDAQVFKKQWGLGVQFFDRLCGVSVKYALSPASGVQAVVCPFNTKTADGMGSLRYYGLRYLYKLPADEDYYLRIEPYIVAGAGLLDYQAADTDNNMFFRVSGGAAAPASRRQSLPGYCAGAGLEWWLGNVVSISAEVDYGRMRFNNGVADHAFFGAAGLHVFLK